jgi:hypothetical protein
VSRIHDDLHLNAAIPSGSQRAGSIRSLKGDRADRGVGLMNGLQNQPAATLSRVCL